MEKDSFMTIGGLAKKMNVTVRTLQYYDNEELLKPSAFSEGGRRMYSSKDIVMLHQILAFKYLGFSLDEIKKMIVSLDSPQQVAKILHHQRENIETQIKNLQSALYAITVLQSEVLRAEQVDFKKYAEIIQVLRFNTEDHWVLKCFDDTLTKHLQNKFTKEPEKISLMWDTYRSLLEQSFELQQKNEPPDSESSLQLAKKWWDMITEFTDGDMSLLPNLIEFNRDKADWDAEMAEKQKAIDSYLGMILNCYFAKNEMNIPEMWEPYKHLVEQTFTLQQKNEPPDSESSLQLAKNWWDMITEFTNGDMSLIPKIMEFNRDNIDWDEEMEKKQKIIDSYLTNILNCYFIENGINVPEME